MLNKDYQRSLSIFRELKPRLIEARGLDHPDILVVLRNEGIALRSIKKFDESQVVFEQTMDISKRMYGLDHPATARNHGDFGAMLVEAEKFSAAEPHLLTAFEIYLRTSGSEHPRTKDMAQWLVRLYEKTGRNDQAEPYRQYNEE